jgi:hypothetical protein
MEMNHIPRVTVLIDTYNHERFIERAIASVLDQDMPMDGVEILVVDDGSTDRTPDLVRQFEPRVRLLRKANGGQASAFNAGIPECRGEIIALLDGDDWWAPGKLRRVVDLMTADPSLGIVGHAIVESSEDGAERIIALGAPERLRLDSAHAANAFRLHRCFFGTSRMTLRSKIARKILPVPEALVFEADEYIFTMANALSEGFILTEPLTHYRVHSGNLFLNSGGNREGECRKLKVLTALVAELRQALPACGMPDEVAAPILELIQAEAAQLRLKLDGGSGWQTYQVEGTIYRIQHGDASLRQRLFHEAMMLPALVLPPRLFYSARQWLASRPWYKQARRKLLPVPGFTHIHASELQEEDVIRSTYHE